eukprot:m.20440 g.20440  ORF g.20440 m.20440 type:complete len:120 (+) comp28017_c0_seq4:855-1214(+)
MSFVSLHLHFRSSTVNVEMDPPLPAARRFLLNRMPVGHLIKCVLTYETAFWRDSGYSGEIISSSSTHQVGNTIISSPIFCAWDGTTADGLPALVLLHGGRTAIPWIDQNVQPHSIADPG